VLRDFQDPGLPGAGSAEVQDQPGCDVELVDRVGVRVPERQRGGAVLEGNAENRGILEGLDGTAVMIESIVGF